MKVSKFGLTPSLCHKSTHIPDRYTQEYPNLVFIGVGASEELLKVNRMPQIVNSKPPPQELWLHWNHMLPLCCQEANLRHFIMVLFVVWLFFQCVTRRWESNVV